MKYTLFFLLGALAFTSLLPTVEAASEEDAFYQLLSTPVPLPEEPLQGSFLRIYEKVHGFVPTQTKLDMERLIALQSKGRGDRLNSQDLQRIANEGCYDPQKAKKTPQDAASPTSVTLSGQTYTLSYYLDQCKKIRSINTRFAKVLSSLAYKSVFMDGDEKNSSYDLLSDVNMLKRMVDGKNPPVKATWNVDVSEDAKYLMGFTYKPQYEVPDPKKIEELQKLYSFENSTSTLGMCLMGDTQKKAPSFTEEEKTSITKSFARFERDKETPDPSFDNEAILKKDPSGKLTDALLGVAKNTQYALDYLGKDNCASGEAYNKEGTGGMAGACIKLEIKPGMGAQTPPVFTAEVSMVSSLADSLQKMKLSTTELAHQNLQLKNEPRSIFSLGWEDFQFKFPANPIEVTYVPMVPVIEKKQYATKHTVRTWADLWNVLTFNTTSATSSTVKATNTLQAGLASQQERVSATKEVKDLGKRLVSPQINQASLSDMETTVGAQLDHILEELDLLNIQVHKFKSQSKQFLSTPTK